MKTLLTATAVSALMIGSAFAACDSDETTYYTHTGTGTLADPYLAVEQCRKLEQNTVLGIPAVTGDFKPVIVGGVPLVVDGKPIMQPYNGWTNNPKLSATNTVLGTNNAALGNGATVYGTTTVVDDGGTPDDPTDDTTSVEYVAVNHSTAIGAGAHADKDNQVAIGTSEDTITAPGITSQKSKDRQSGPLQVVTSDASGNLASDGGYIFNSLASHSAQLVDHGSRIGSLESITAGHELRLNAQDALLSEHTAQLDKQAKGLAIAMAMPDAWLSDKERFAVAGSFGGFGDETAFGFAAIARIDQTWSLNAKAGADTSFEEFGFAVGARAGW